MSRSGSVSSGHSGRSGRSSRSSRSNRSKVSNSSNGSRLTEEIVRSSVTAIDDDSLSMKIMKLAAGVPLGKSVALKKQKIRTTEEWDEAVYEDGRLFYEPTYRVYYDTLYYWVTPRMEDTVSMVEERPSRRGSHFSGREKPPSQRHRFSGGGNFPPPPPPHFEDEEEYYEPQYDHYHQPPPPPPPPPMNNFSGGNESPAFFKLN